MPKSRLLSIIIPVYNAERGIETTISSISENCRERFEIIVVDDASTDDTVKKISQCAPENCRLLALKENHGPGIARNHGLREAVGRYIAFIDAGDWVDPDFVERALNIIDADELGVDIYFFGFKNIKHGYIEKIGPPEPKNLKKAYILDEILCSVFNKIYRREVIADKSIVFPDLRRGEDLVFNARFIRHARTHISIQNLYYNYDCRDASLTRQRYSLNVLNAHDIANELLRQELSGVVENFDAMFFAREFRFIFMYSLWRMTADRAQGVLSSQVKSGIQKELRERFSLNRVLAARYLTAKEKILFVSFKFFTPLTYLAFSSTGYLRKISARLNKFLGRP